MTAAADAPGGAERLPPGEGLRALRAAVSLALRASPVSVLLLTLLTLLSAGVPVTTAWLTRLVLDRLAGAGDAELLGLALGLAGAGLCASLLPRCGQYLGNHLGRVTGMRAVDRLFTAVNSFAGIARFENPLFLDRLPMAQAAGSQSIGRVVTGTLAVLGAALTTCGFVVALWTISPLMTGLVVAAGAPTLVAELLLSRHRARAAWRINSFQRHEIFYQMLLASLDAAKEIRLFGIGGFLQTRMLTQRRAADAERRTADRNELLTQGGLSLLSALVSGIGLVWAALAARRGELTVGDVSMLVAGVVGVQSALSLLVGGVADLHHELLMIGHYLAVVRAGPDLEGPPSGQGASAVLPPLQRGIELRDVWFRYSDGHPWILRGVDLYIPHGQAVALVGRNGAGKSTLVKLLCRFYDPTRGVILWDGVDLRDVPAEELRGRLGAVFQDFMRYDLTAAENIAVGDLSALGDEPRIRAAAHRAGIDAALASLPDGYGTLLSRRFAESTDGGRRPGALLSGGQSQRIALARAFLRVDRDLLILDEPSSGLDAEAEADVHQRLSRHREGRTSLLISHRLSAVRTADRIVVLTRGRITESGTHDELLTEDGTYARLFSLQAKGYQDA